MPDVAPLEFIWSDEKGASNFEKHHIDFLDAVRIFEGPVYEVAVVRNAELRYKAVGVVESVEIVVVYTERGRVLRIISARRAKKNEREAYHAYCTLSRR
jgi:uncharacterized DUF497 family protein